MEFFTKGLKDSDIEIFESIEKEKARQNGHLELIASENNVSKAVLDAIGSIMTNKYAEGYPGKRYYGGCEYVDVAENLAIERAKKLFGAKFANVQPHSGSQANMGAYMALIEEGDKIMGMDLSHGGHLTHGHPMSFSGKMYEVVDYKVSEDTFTIDYDALREKAIAEKPNLIIAGASAYPRAIDFKKFREIADEVGAFLVVDMAHIAGLVAADLHQSPIPYAHITTTTTHKTLRGPRGGLILTNDEAIAKKINSKIFPGIQGGPLMHTIAGKAVAFKEALQPSFNVYMTQVVKNAAALAKALQDNGFTIVSGGTDNHLMLVDVSAKGYTGKVVEACLDKAGLNANKNTIPFDKEKPFVTSGIRLGTPSLTTRGMVEADMKVVADFFKKAVDNIEDDAALEAIEKEVGVFAAKFPMYA